LFFYHLPSPEYIPDSSWFKMFFLTDKINEKTSFSGCMCVIQL
jgi:hypothetical protein